MCSKLARGEGFEPPLPASKAGDFTTLSIPDCAEHKNRGVAAVTIDSYVLFVLQTLSNRSRLHEN